MASFVTSDWHLGDSRFIILGRPFRYVEDFISTLRDNHNSMVNPGDVVYCLGDMVNNGNPEFLPLIETFNGDKILIRGNHDRQFTDEQLKRYFTEIIPEGDGSHVDVAGINCWMTHYPSCAKPDVFNLVGHVHNTWRVQLNMLNVGVDANHFMPVRLDAIPFHHNAICNHYDDDVWAAYHPVNQTLHGTIGVAGTYFKKEPKL